MWGPKKRINFLWAFFFFGGDNIYMWALFFGRRKATVLFASRVNGSCICASPMSVTSLVNSFLLSLKRIVSQSRFKHIS